MQHMDETVVTVRGREDVADEREPDFGLFFEQHHVRLFRALWLVTRNRHEAEELTQDAFLRLWQR
jgi:DNA-directed RNA polymerase specialized sigma24 family protein